MALTVYKSGQGYWTRVLTAIGASTLVAAALAFTWAELDGAIRDDDVRMYTQAGVCVVVIVMFGIVAWRLLNRPKFVDFMIATDAEMRKVNWPSRREIIGSTIVVVCGTFLLTLILYVVNILFAWLFTEINILESAKS